MNRGKFGGHAVSLGSITLRRSVPWECRLGLFRFASHCFTVFPYLSDSFCPFPHELRWTEGQAGVTSCGYKRASHHCAVWDDVNGVWMNSLCISQSGRAPRTCWAGGCRFDNVWICLMHNLSIEKKITTCQENQNTSKQFKKKCKNTLKHGVCFIFVLFYFDIIRLYSWLSMVFMHLSCLDLSWGRAEEEGGGCEPCTFEPLSLD